jgi:hypothetical protein
LNATADGSTVTVTWSTTGITWNNTTGQDLEVVVTGGEVADNTCTTGTVDFDDTTCSFTAVGTEPTTYTVTVTATNQDGDSITVRSDNVLVSEPEVPPSAPTGTVDDLNVVASGATVTVSWDPSGITGWGTGTDHGFEVDIEHTSGLDKVGASTCDDDGDPLPKTATGCQFTATAMGTFTVTVTARSSVDSGDGAQGAVAVSAIGPTGTVDVDTPVVDGAEVTVTWDPVTGITWGNTASSTHKFDVVVEPGTIEDSDCTTGLAKSVGTCSFTATAGGTYTITVTPRNSAGGGLPVEVEAEVAGTAPDNEAADLDLLTTVDGADVHVTWNAADVDWGLFPVDSGFDIVITGGTVGTNDCGVNPDGTNDSTLSSTTEECTFTATEDETTYTIELTPRNDEGPGTAATDNAMSKEAAPDSSLEPDASEPDENGVRTISWDLSDISWGTGEDRTIDVVITPSASGSGASASSVVACDTDMAEDVDECSFAPSQGGVHTVTITPKTEEGSGAPMTETFSVEAEAPTGPVSGLDTSVSGATVTVEWDPSSVDWGIGANRVLNVVVTGGEVGSSTCTPGLASTEDSCEFTALQAATYMITVTPANSEGTASPASDEAIVGTVAPSTPTEVSVTPGASELMVSWTGGESNGIDAAYYTATANPNGATCSTAEGTECTIAGLTPGTPYTVTVVAYSASGAGSEPSEADQGTPVGASPSGATARNANGQLQVFARAGNGSVVTSLQDQNGDWGAWTSLGGSIVGEPMAIRSGSGQLHLLAVGSDTAVWQLQETSAGSNTWSAWTSLGPGDVRSVAVAVSGGGVATFVSRTGDGSVFAQSQVAANSTSWSGWTNLNFRAVNDPRLVVNNGGNLEVIAVGTDNALWHSVRTGTVWSPWTQISTASSAIAA